MKNTAALTLLIFFISVFVSVFASTANAILPTSRTIFSRTTKGHGKGAYVVEQDVTFKSEVGDALVLREKWTVINAETMRLSVSQKNSADTHIEVVYRAGKRTGFESSRATPVSAEFAEPYFYFRTPLSLQSALIRAKVLPSDFGQKQRQIVPLNPSDKSENASLVSVNEPYLRLSRTGGVVSYELGRVSEQENSGIWIEEDAFNIRKIKFPTQSAIEADQYLSYANNFHFPRERTFKWGNNIVTARVISIRVATDQEAAKSISSSEETPTRIPEVPGLKEFYLRFR